MKNEIDQEKNAKFLDLAQVRGKSAIKSIRLIALMCKSRAYDMNQKQVEAIVGRIHDEADKILTAYNERIASKDQKSNEIEDIDFDAETETTEETNDEDD